MHLDIFEEVIFLKIPYLFSRINSFLLSRNLKPCPGVLIWRLSKIVVPQTADPLCTVSPYLGVSSMVICLIRGILENSHLGFGEDAFFLTLKRKHELVGGFKNMLVKLDHLQVAGVKTSFFFETTT